MVKMTAMLVVSTAGAFTGGSSVAMHPVCTKPFGEDGSSEENSFARWTPGGSLNLDITNPELVGKFKEGQKFRVYFEEVEESVVTASKAVEEVAATSDTNPSANP